jgi:hypothetical protein
MIDAILGVVVGVIFGALATDYWWHRHFQKLKKNIHAILEDKPVARKAV